MKKVLFIVGMALVATFGTTGCKSVPTADTVRVIAKAGGGATGLALNYVDIDTEAAVVLTNIVSNVGACTPKEGETVQDAIVRTSEAHVDILVARGDLTAQQGAMVMAGVRMVVKGYDLVIVWKPEIALYTELTVAALDGFSEGFLATYRPDSALKGCGSAIDEAYRRNSVNNIGVLTSDSVMTGFFKELTNDPEYKLMLRK